MPLHQPNQSQLSALLLSLRFQIYRLHWIMVSLETQEGGWVEAPLRIIRLLKGLIMQAGLVSPTQTWMVGPCMGWCVPRSYKEESCLKAEFLLQITGNAVVKEARRFFRLFSTLSSAWRDKLFTTAATPTTVHMGSDTLGDFLTSAQIGWIFMGNAAGWVFFTSVLRSVSSINLVFPKNSVQLHVLVN